MLRFNILCASAMTVLLAFSGRSSQGDDLSSTFAPTCTARKVSEEFPAESQISGLTEAIEHVQDALKENGYEELAKLPITGIRNPFSPDFAYTRSGEIIINVCRGKSFKSKNVGFFGDRSKFRAIPESPLTFIIAHEAAHLVRGDYFSTDNFPKFLLSEIAADEFAIELLHPKFGERGLALMYLSFRDEIRINGGNACRSLQTSLRDILMTVEDNARLCRLDHIRQMRFSLMTDHLMRRGLFGSEPPIPNILLRAENSPDCEDLIVPYCIEDQDNHILTDIKSRLKDDIDTIRSTLE